MAVMSCYSWHLSLVLLSYNMYNIYIYIFGTHSEMKSNRKSFDMIDIVQDVHRGMSHSHVTSWYVSSPCHMHLTDHGMCTGYD